MPTFTDAKRADRLAAIQQMASKNAPPHWWEDPELAAALKERAELELREAEEQRVPLVTEAEWEFQALQELESGPASVSPSAKPKSAPVRAPKGR